MKLRFLLLFIGWATFLVSCQKDEVAPNRFMNPIRVNAEPQAGLVTLRWQAAPIGFCGTGLTEILQPTQPTTYEVWFSDSDPDQVKKIATVSGNVQELVVPNLSAGRSYYAQVKALHLGLSTQISNVAMTVTGAVAQPERVFAGDPPYAVAGSWSGTRLVYQGRLLNSNNDGIILYTQGVSKLLQANGYLPAFAPDGRTVAFTTRDWASAKPTQLVFLNTETGQVTSRDIPTQLGSFSVEWSRDGRWLAYVTATATGGYQLWKLAVTGGEPIALTSVQPQGTQTQLQYSQLTWSSDGQFILATQLQADNTRNQMVGNLVRIPADGGIPETFLTSHSNDQNPAFSPDGKSLAFISDRSGYMAVWVKDLTTGQLRQVTGDSKQYLSYTNRLEWLANGRLSFTGSAANTTAGTTLFTVAVSR